MDLTKKNQINKNHFASDESNFPVFFPIQKRIFSALRGTIFETEWICFPKNHAPHLFPHTILFVNPKSNHIYVYICTSIYRL